VRTPPPPPNTHYQVAFSEPSSINIKSSDLKEGLVSQCPSLMAISGQGCAPEDSQAEEGPTQNPNSALPRTPQPISAPSEPP
jgi:hypothetical protein